MDHKQMTKKIRLENKFIGMDYPCFIIAEAGVNHNGNVKIAKKLIDEAKKAGADAIKFQTFRTEDLVTRNTRMARYQKKNLGTQENSQFEMLKRLELSHENFMDLKDHCRKRRTIFLSTAHSENEIDFLDTIVGAHKIASGDLTNIPFLQKIAKTLKPMILSTGMGTMKEIREAIDSIKQAGNDKIAVLHCTTNYPCPLNEVNLRAMLSIQEETGLIVGYSDHTEGINTSVLAAAMGAKIIEKHFTLDKGMRGPDHKASIETEELARMVIAIRETEMILGNGIKTPTRSEKVISAAARKSVIAKVNIPKGKMITAKMLIIKRPGTGIRPGKIHEVIGKIARRNIIADNLIKWNQIR
ncbi:MAG: N-acetylneuraminate synthase [Candidatus Paceibacterota bacterium]|jgi:N-acetylneuraminate synthase